MKKGVPVLYNVFQGFCVDQIRAVCACVAAVVGVQQNHFRVMPEMIGKVVVSKPLTVVAIEFFEALGVGFTFGIDISKTPFPVSPCCVPLCL